MFSNLEIAASIPASQQELRDRCFHPSDPRSTFSRGEIEGLIADGFESVVDLYADRLAVRTKNHELTYSALNAAANRLAREIRELGPRRQGPVPLLFDLDVPAIIAILGVLRAGRPYAALDPTFPHARLDHPLDDLQASLLVANNQHLPLGTSLAQNGCQLVDTDEIRPDLSHQNLGLAISPDTLAGIFYTSGSTGKPKGVIRDHRAMLHRTWYEPHSYHICAKVPGWSDRRAPVSRAPSDPLRKRGSIRGGRGKPRYMLTARAHMGHLCYQRGAPGRHHLARRTMDRMPPDELAASWTEDSLGSRSHQQLGWCELSAGESRPADSGRPTRPTKENAS